MRVALSKTGRFVGKISLQIVPSVAASVLGGYLLAQLVPQHTATATENTAEAEKAKSAAVSAKGPAVVNDKAPIRVTSQPRRETQAAAEPPAEVKRTVAAEVAAPVAAAPVEPAVREPKPARVKAAAVTPAATPPQLYTPEPYTPEASTPQVASQPVLQAYPVARVQPPMNPAPVVATAPALPPATNIAPVNAATQTGALAAGTPTQLAPVVVTARKLIEPPPDEEDVAVAEKGSERGVAGHVFSATSTVAGSAANAIGNTVNWVFELPGKLINRDGQNEAPRQQASQPRRFM